MLALLLVGCAPCPTFGEMTVDDPHGLASDNMLDDVDAAVSDFAAWTGRAGVCVPGITVREDVRPDSDPDWEIVGMYKGQRRPILLEPGLTTSTHQVVVHELCHALDYREDLRASWPADLFPSESVEQTPAYRTESTREHEAFARACEEGPTDVVLATEIDARCGTESVTGQQAYINAVVYASFPTTTLDPSPLSLTIGAQVLDIDPAYTVYDATGFEGYVLLLVDWFGVVADDGYHMRVLEVDPATGAVTGQVDLPVAAPWGGTFAASDGLPVVIVGNSSDAGDLRAEAFRVDPRLGTATKLDVAGLPPYVDSAAFAGGQLYVADWDVSTPRLSAWDLAAGTRVDLPADVAIHSLQPTAQGLEKADLDGLSRLNADGAWEALATRPLGAWGFVPLAGDDRLWIGGAENNVPVVLNASTAAWSIPADPCATRPIVGPTALFSLNGEAAVLGSERDDGTGRPVLYTIHVGGDDEP